MQRAALSGGRWPGSFPGVGPGCPMSDCLMIGCDMFLGRLAGSPVPGVGASEQAGLSWGLITHCC